MFEIVTAYNFVLLGLDLLAVMIIWRTRSVVAWFLGVMLIGVAAPVIAGLMAHLTFLGVRLLAFGWFLHVPLVSILGAWGLRREHRRFSILAAAFGGVVLLIATDAFWVEPRWLEIEHVRLESSKLDRPYRLVLMADLQTDELSDYERRVFLAVQEAQPDLVLMAGDYLQSAHAETPALKRKYREFLEEIEFGETQTVYVVGGNNDNGSWEEMYASVPVYVFKSSHTVDVAPDLAVTGLALVDSFNRDLTIDSREQFQIAVGHAPDYALSETAKADLLLAGHTHGGQVRLPFVGPLVTLSSVPRSWAAGVTKLDADRTLIVSRGIGHERGEAPRLRFLCRPQIVVIDLVPSGQEQDSTMTQVSEAAVHSSSSPSSSSGSSSSSSSPAP